MKKRIRIYAQYANLAKNTGVEGIKVKKIDLVHLHKVNFM